MFDLKTLPKIKKKSIYQKMQDGDNNLLITYGFNKKYKFGIVIFGDTEKWFINPKILERTDPILIKNSMYFKNYVFEAETEYGDFKKRQIVLYLHSNGEDSLHFSDLESICIQNIIEKLL